MAEIALRPLLAHAPEKSPPARWWLFLLPLALATLGALLAPLVAARGQAAARELAEARLAATRADLELRLGRARQQEDAVRIVQLDAALAAAREAKIPAYLLSEQPLMRGDGRQFAAILTQGYRPPAGAAAGGSGHALSVAYYPLYPLLAAGVMKLTGAPPDAALAAVARLSLMAASVLLFALARRHFHNRLPPLDLGHVEEDVTRRWDLRPADTAALWTVAFLLFGPAAIYLYANSAQSLMVLLLVLVLFCIQSRAWWAAAAAAALASAAGASGVLFGPIVAVTYLLRSDAARLWRRVGMGVGLLAVAEVGLLGYIAYQYFTFGNPWAFMQAQRTWNLAVNGAALSYAVNPANPLTNFFRYVFTQPIDWPRLYDAFAVIVPPVLLMLLGARFLSFEQELAGWLLWGVAYVGHALAGSSGGLEQHWVAMGRAGASLVPIPLILGAVLVRFRWLGPPLLAGSAVLFAMLAYGYGEGS